MKDLRGRNCTGAKAAGVKKQALDVDKMQSIKSIVLATYGKNEKFNSDLWQECKDRINRAVRYTCRLLDGEI